MHWCLLLLLPQLHLPKCFAHCPKLKFLGTGTITILVLIPTLTPAIPTVASFDDDTCLKAQPCERPPDRAQQRQTLSFQDRKRLSGTMLSPSKRISGCGRQGSKSQFSDCTWLESVWRTTVLSSTTLAWLPHWKYAWNVQEPQPSKGSPENGKQPNCCSRMFVISKPQQDSRLPKSCLPACQHQNFSTENCWWLLPGILNLLLLLSSLSHQLPAQLIWNKFIRDFNSFYVICANLWAAWKRWKASSHLKSFHCDIALAETYSSFSFHCAFLWFSTFNVIIVPFSSSATWKVWKGQQLPHSVLLLLPTW